MSRTEIPRRKATRSRRFLWSVDDLEARLAPAVVGYLFVQNETLVYAGTDAPNLITVSGTDTDLTISDSAGSIDAAVPGFTGNGTGSVSGAVPSGVTTIAINVNGNNPQDTITIPTSPGLTTTRNVVLEAPTINGQNNIDAPSVTDGNAPVTDLAPSANFAFSNTVGSASAFNITDGANINGIQTTLISSGDTPPSFPFENFANKTDAEISTLIDSTVAQTIALDNPTAATGLTTLGVHTGLGNSTVNVTATPAGVATSITNPSVGVDTFNVTASGLGAGSKASFTVTGGTTGTDVLNVDAGGKLVDFSKGIITVGGDKIAYSNIGSINITNAADPALEDPVAETVTTTEGSAVTNVPVGMFTDADPLAQKSNYTVAINWGDGTPLDTTTGTVVPTGGLNTPFEVEGSHTYTQAGNYTITVMVTDVGNTGETNVGGVPIMITDPGGSTTKISSTADVVGQPTANPQTITTAENAAQKLTLTGSDPNTPPLPLTFAIATAPTHGAISGFNALTGALTYTPSTGYTGPDSFTFTTYNGTAISAAATVSINVVPTTRTLVVTTTADLVGGVPAAGSLRANILAANANPGPETILFDIVPRAAVYNIVLDAPLPAVTQSVTIDATTQPGYAGAPIVGLDGAAVQGTGLQFEAGQSGVQGMAIGGFSVAGITVTAGGDLITHDDLGTNIAGTAALGNGIGVLVENGAWTTISNNVISGNLSAGVYVKGGTVTGTTIVGNRIGTDPTGSTPIVQPGTTNPVDALQNTGVVIDGSGGNTVASNVISGNYVGVMIANAGGSGNQVVGNLIGTTASGLQPLGNVVGVYLNGAPGNLVTGNTVSANSSVGVELFGAATGNQIRNDLIGLAADGHGIFQAANGTFIQQTGVYVEGASGNTISGDTISGNQLAGVYIISRSGTATGNVVTSNFIGAGPGGSTGPGNQGYGVLLYNAPRNTVVRVGSSANRFQRNGLVPVEIFTGPLPATATLSQVVPSRVHAHGVKAHPAGPKVHLRQARK